MNMMHIQFNLAIGFDINNDMVIPEIQKIVDSLPLSESYIGTSTCHQCLGDKPDGSDTNLTK